MMNVEYDIFISFLSKDDENLDGASYGWVSGFEKFLDGLLFQLLGRHPKVLRSVDGDQQDKASKSLAVISILSPGYVESVPCVKEAEKTFNIMNESQSLKIDNCSRYFKVLKSFVPSGKHPEGLKSLFGYNLFNVNLQTGDSIEIKDFFANDVDSTYWLRMVDLAHDLYDLIMTHEDKRNDFLSVEGSGEYIYLAAAPRDLSIQRDVVKRELQRHGYQILPTSNLSVNSENIEELILEDLKKCKLSIHFISGSNYSTDDTLKDNTLYFLQNKIAAKYSGDLIEKDLNKEYIEFPRFIWIPPHFNITDEQQKIYIENFKRNAELVVGADVLSVPLEEFKNIIRNELFEMNSRESISKVSENTISSKSIVYLIVDKMDAEEGKKVADHLKVSGYDVIIPEFKGTILEARQMHQLYLNKCDAVLIYMGKVSDKWVNSKAHDVLKSPGFGRKKVLKSKAIFLERGTKIKDQIFLRENKFDIIHNAQEFLSDSLRNFTAKL